MKSGLFCLSQGGGGGRRHPRKFYFQPSTLSQMSKIQLTIVSPRVHAALCSTLDSTSVFVPFAPRDQPVLARKIRDSLIPTMQEDKFAKLTVRVDAARNIDLEIEFCDAHYTVRASRDSLTTTTGLTQLFELIPDVGSLPGFVGRWDDRYNSIDVDPEPHDCIDRDIWRGEKGGFRGHHAATLSADPRIYGTA